MNQLVPDVVPSKDSCNLAVITYLLTVVFGFIPGLVIFLLKKDDAFLHDAGKEALNWSITVMLASCILGWIPVLGWLLVAVLYVCNVVCSVLGAMNASKGLLYRYPFALRLIA